MKKITLLGLLFLFVSLAFVSCSDDNSNVDMNNGDTSVNLKSRSSIWGGPLVTIQNGQAVLAVAESDMLIAFNEYFKSEGYTDQVQNISIVKKTADNDPGESRYFLVGSTGLRADGRAVSANVMLSSDRFGSVELGTDPNMEFVAFCIGCPNGCHIRFIKHAGKLIPYCDEGPCTIYWCEQDEAGNPFTYSD
ncbi:hypothetical protein GN157_02835 [Flavobacterium rakeshii]|uniref:Lipoprotein n=1 Tax=Flavobacterium rakeshii TaxID=1038845 RepID=A0A6N8HBR7_9FLAO|nr:hypothetical protein [Flavobacterium rakeshii]MEE1897745.1 hypothetical protein [Flavobacterium rakeshii]MUV02636.1 hypothetical protein [Flavobacterium rakeshii]